jgi:hypothetical protein
MSGWCSSNCHCRWKKWLMPDVRPTFRIVSGREGDEAMTAIGFRRSAVLRATPFAAFMALLWLRGAAQGYGGFDSRWIYGASVLIVGGLLALWRREYSELARRTLPRARDAALAVAAGLLVFALWINLDAPWMTIGEPTAVFVPFGRQGTLDMPLVVVRWIGATLVVPLMEELFWRSFLMRWLQDPEFESIPPHQVGLKALALSTLAFMLAHTLWLAAIVAGLVYAWLYIRTGKLWVPVIAHAVTNGALGLWVVSTGNWQFW